MEGGVFVEVKKLEMRRRVEVEKKKKIQASSGGLRHFLSDFRGLRQGLAGQSAVRNHSGLGQNCAWSRGVSHSEFVSLIGVV